MSIQSLSTQDDLVDEKDAAAVLTLKVATLRNWRALKQGPKFIKLGKRAVRYRRGDLAAFIAGVSEKDV